MQVDLKQQRKVVLGSHAANEARKAYKREWNRKNKDKVKEYQRRYWERKAEEAARQGGTDPGEAKEG